MPQSLASERNGYASQGFIPKKISKPSVSEVHREGLPLLFSYTISLGLFSWIELPELPSNTYWGLCTDTCRPILNSSLHAFSSDAGTF